ncbi:MAG: tRNA epoxyqueuosine(34) reductase QueG [Armatimonadetes bacterium]|nr:tRNA epoxyqueuosine(34) reductase QueG [Armatimonadota bacterium]
MTSDQLKALAFAEGFELVGITPAVPAQHLDFYDSWLGAGFHGEMDYMQRQRTLRESPESLLPGVKSLVAVGLNYNQPQPKEVKIARYALGRDYHKVLRGKLKRIAKEMPGACRVCVDTAPLFEREIAQQAGLGWFGKNTMLINSARGSWFVLGFILCTEEFEYDHPAVGGCGTCRKCIDACPTGAIVEAEGRWQIDARSCISYLTIEHRGPIREDLKPKIKDLVFGCDICQEVCPFNTPRPSQPLRAEHTSCDEFLRLRTWPDIESLVNLEESTWDDLTQGSPVRRAGVKGLRRNALIVAENRAKGTPR